MALLRFILLFFFWLPNLYAQEFEVPRIKNFINDYARIIDSHTEAQLNGELDKLKKQTGVEFAVLTVGTTNGIPIEMASIQVTDKWKLGTKEEDKGLLLLIAHKDRRLRIEVGQGLEGSLTDAYSKRIIDQVIVPRFKQGDFSGGVQAGVYAIVQRAVPGYILGSRVPPVIEGQSSRKKESSRWDLFLLILKILGFLIIIFIRFSLFGGRSYYGGGGFGGGGFGGGGGSFGGGGGFSGGGSSGSW